MNTSNWRLRRTDPETMTLLADYNGGTIKLADIYCDTDLTEAALIMSAQRLQADVLLADQAITDRMAVIRDQAAQIDEMKVLLDTQDAIITRLRMEQVKK